MLSVFPAPDSPLAPQNTKSSHGSEHIRNSGMESCPPVTARFAFSLPDDTTLVTVVPLHVEVTVVSNGKNMWRQFTNLLIGVLSNLVGCVDRQQLIGVHSHQDGASVGLHRGERDVERKRTHSGSISYS